MSFKAYFLAARPATLIAAIAPVLIGTRYAQVTYGIFNLNLFLCCLTSATAIQIATNYYNDALDYVNGADNSERVGPRRMVADGVLSVTQMNLAALLAILLAILSAIPMLLSRGWPILAIGIPSLVFAYGYTGAPFKLAYRGLGEVFVILFFGLVAVAGSSFVQTANFETGAALLGLQSGLLAATLIALNNLRDLDTDKKVGKNTLAVRLGANFTKLMVSLFLLLPLAIEFLRGLKIHAFAIILYAAIVGIVLINLWGKNPKTQFLLMTSALLYLIFTLGYLCVSAPQNVGLL